MKSGRTDAAVEDEFAADDAHEIDRGIEVGHRDADMLGAPQPRTDLPMVSGPVPARWAACGFRRPPLLPYHRHVAGVGQYRLDLFMLAAGKPSAWAAGMTPSFAHTASTPVSPPARRAGSIACPPPRSPGCARWRRALWNAIQPLEAQHVLHHPARSSHPGRRRARKALPSSASAGRRRGSRRCSRSISSPRSSGASRPSEATPVGRRGR